MSDDADKPTSLNVSGSAPGATAGVSDALTPQDVGGAALAGQQQAEDSDLIEIEWVNKAKAAVEETRLDPYEQNRRLAQIKAEYLQKRYGKTIKLTE